MPHLGFFAKRIERTSRMSASSGKSAEELFLFSCLSWDILLSSYV